MSFVFNWCGSFKGDAGDIDPGVPGSGKKKKNKSPKEKKILKFREEWYHKPASYRHVRLSSKMQKQLPEDFRTFKEMYTKSSEFFSTEEKLLIVGTKDESKLNDDVYPTDDIYARTKDQKTNERTLHLITVPKTLVKLQEAREAYLLKHTREVEMKQRSIEKYEEDLEEIRSSRNDEYTYKPSIPKLSEEDLELYVSLWSQNLIDLEKHKTGYLKHMDEMISTFTSLLKATKISHVLSSDLTPYLLTGTEQEKLDEIKIEKMRKKRCIEDYAFMKLKDEKYLVIASGPRISVNSLPLPNTKKRKKKKKQVNDLESVMDWYYIDISTHSKIRKRKTMNVEDLKILSVVPITKKSDDEEKENGEETIIYFITNKCSSVWSVPFAPPTNQNPNQYKNPKKNKNKNPGFQKHMMKEHFYFMNLPSRFYHFDFTYESSPLSLQYLSHPSYSSQYLVQFFTNQLILWNLRTHKRIDFDFRYITEHNPNSSEKKKKIRVNDDFSPKCFHVMKESGLLICALYSYDDNESYLGVYDIDKGFLSHVTFGCEILSVSSYFENCKEFCLIVTKDRKQEDEANEKNKSFTIQLLEVREDKKKLKKKQNKKKSYKYFLKRKFLVSGDFVDISTLSIRNKVLLSTRRAYYIIDLKFGLGWYVMSQKKNKMKKFEMHKVVRLVKWQDDDLFFTASKDTGDFKVRVWRNDCDWRLAQRDNIERKRLEEVEGEGED